MWCTVILVFANAMVHARAPLTGREDADASHPPENVVRVGRATIAIQWRGPAADVGQSGLRDWVERSATIVGSYYGDFPVSTATIWISTIDGDSMGGGRTFGLPQPRIEVSVGRHITARALKDDWVLVHEMIHLALPAVADEQNWLAEGLATYVEGVARVQAGNMSDAALWTEYLKAMPKGLPQANDGGLDRTHTHARTYWGGALYCLTADVRIRERTGSRRGLQDALRAISHSGGGMSAQWPVERILAGGDEATGTTVLQDLYLWMKDQPTAPDLDALWADLGIRMTDGVVRFDDSARLAAVRRAITRAPPDGVSQNH
jgi:hypothetical protein